MMKLSIDRKQVKDAFAEYVQAYNAEDEKIKLKIEHTDRVAKLSDQIARKLNLSEYDTDLAWLIGMLHDIGRFEQLRRYHTFVDAVSIDHAHFGVDLLFRDGLLKRFLEDSEKQQVHEEYEVIRKAIWNHSAFRIEPELSLREFLFAKIIRDADKIDILKVANDIPLETIYDVTTQELHAAPVSEEVMVQFRQEQTIERSAKRVPVDFLVGHIALVFELEFAESYQIVEQQGYLDKLLDFTTPNPQIQMQFQELRQHMEEFVRRKKDAI